MKKKSKEKSVFCGKNILYDYCIQSVNRNKALL